MRTMKAAVIYEAGGPEVLKIESRPIPTPQLGEVLIRVKAFGLNRSELFTRQGLSPGVVFPSVSGIRVRLRERVCPHLVRGRQSGRGCRVASTAHCGRDASSKAAYCQVYRA